MSYTCILDEGVVIKTGTLEIVAPTTSIDTVEYVQYQTWLSQGNTPDTIPTRTSLESLKLAIRQQIKDIRDCKTQTGGYRVGNSWFHSDIFSRSQQLGLMMLGSNMPANIMWKTMDGSFILMTPTLASQVFAAAVANDMAMFTRAEMLSAEVLQSTTPNLIDIQAGWPATYSGAV